MRSGSRPLIVCSCMGFGLAVGLRGSDRGGFALGPIRRLVACVVCCLAMLVFPAATFAEQSLSGSAGGVSGSLLGNPLVVTGAPMEPEQLKADEEARRFSPDAVVARKESETKYEGLDPGQAEKLAGEAFPRTVDDPAGGPPKLSAGTTATGFPTDNAESVDLPGGRHGVIQSLAPIAQETSPGHRVALDLTPHESGDGFAPASGLVDVHIPKHVSDGASLSEAGVSLTPVDEHGVPLEGAEGVIDGASVFYGNTENAGAGVRDVDTLVKPETSGFEEETLLRSEKSPSTLYYKAGLPEGAKLVPDRHGLHVVLVVDAGQTIAVISAPAAEDAEGVSVPFSLAVDGDMVVLSVQRGAGEDDYPVEVDPSVESKSSHHFYGWHFYTPYSSSFHNRSEYEEEFGACFLEYQEEYSSYCEDYSSSYTEKQWAEFFYETQGESRIYALKAATEQENGSNFKSTLRIQSEAGDEKGPTTLSASGKSESSLCVSEGCGAVAVEPEAKPKHDANGVYFEQEALVTGTTAFWNKLTGATVSIEQEAGPSAALDTSDSQFEVDETEYVNALAPGVWVSGSNEKNKLMLGLKAFDPGLGIKNYTVKSPNSSFWSSTGSPGCNGVQCIECFDMGEDC